MQTKNRNIILSIFIVLLLVTITIISIAVLSSRPTDNEPSEGVNTSNSSAIISNTENTEIKASNQRYTTPSGLYSIDPLNWELKTLNNTDSLKPSFSNGITVHLIPKKILDEHQRKYNNLDMVLTTIVEGEIKEEFSELTKSLEERLGATGNFTNINGYTAFYIRQETVAYAERYYLVKNGSSIIQFSFREYSVSTVSGTEDYSEYIDEFESIVRSVKFV